MSDLISRQAAIDALQGRKHREEMKVLSLFDGISCGMIALERESEE